MGTHPIFESDFDCLTDMGRDFYKTLDVSREASDRDIKKAYRKLALKYHPDKNQGDAAAEAKFKEISAAFEVLSDPKKKEKFDRFGEEGLQGGGMGGGHGGFGGADPNDIFRMFFGGGAGGGAGGGRRGFNMDDLGDDDDFGGGRLGGGFNFGGHPGMGGGCRGRQRQPEPLKPGEKLEHDLKITLEQLFQGTTKRLKINRKRRSPMGQYVNDEKVLTIDVKPGWKSGTKITFPKEGDEKPGYLAGDIIFVVQEKPHNEWRREGNDLVKTITLPLVDALCGCSYPLQNLAGDTEALTIEPLTQTEQLCGKVFPGFGMPISKKPGTRGDLKIDFSIAYPSGLTPEKKTMLQSVLAS